jgi:hypothetical protein
LGDYHGGHDSSKNGESVSGRYLSSRLRTHGMIDATGAFTESLLIITGSMGSGKTTALAEASDVLALRHTTHAAIDLDALGLACLPSPATNDEVMYRNLQSICENYASHGVRRMLVAHAMEDRAELEKCRGIVLAASTVICRLTASIETMRQRVRAREMGVLRAEYSARVAVLNAAMDRARLEDFTVATENRSPTDVAQEMLTKAGWISD